MGLPSSSQGNPQDVYFSWWFPKYTCYSAFAVLSVLYTLAAHALIRLGVLPQPKIQYPTVSNSNTHSIATREKRVAIVTGSNTGVGYQTARQLVVDHGMDVILACRCEVKARNAAKTINQESAAMQNQGRAIFLQPCDLSSFASVHAFANAVHSNYSTIHVLVNNAGLNTTSRSKDGYDLLFQACFLSHFLLTNLLMDLFPNDGSGRIVNLSSVKHHFQSNYTGWARLDENYWRDSALLHYQRNESYPNAKQAAIFFTLELNRRYGFSSNNIDNSGDGVGGRPPRVHAFVVNPGAVNSDIWRNANLRWLVIPIFKQIFLTTEQGSATSVAAAVGQFSDEDDFYLEPYWMPSRARYKAPFPVLEMLGPFVGYRVTQPRLPATQPAIQAVGETLWKVSEELTQQKFGGKIEASNQSNAAMSTGIDSTPHATGKTQTKMGDHSSTNISKTKINDTSRPSSRPALGLISNTAPTRKKKEN